MADAEMRRVFVGNLAWKTTPRELTKHMSAAGDVVSADIFMDESGRSKGSAIVEYASAEAVCLAIDTLQETILDERSIFVRQDQGGRRKGEKGGKSYGGGKGGKGGEGGRDFDGGKGKDFGKSFEKGFGKRSGKGLGKSGGGGEQLYVGNLPFRATWRDLKDAFREYGQVVRADVAQGDDGRSRGYGIVSFEREAEALAAIAALDGADFQGRNLVVRFERSA